MNTYVTLSCLLAVVALSHGSAIGIGHGLDGLGYGWGGVTVIGAPIVAPAAVSTANMVKAAPIPVVRTIAAPVISAPIYKTLAPISVPVGLGWNSWNGLGWGGYGWNGLGVNKGLGWAGNPWAGYGWGGYGAWGKGGYGWNGLGVNKGLGWAGNPWAGYGWGSYGAWGKH